MVDKKKNKKIKDLLLKTFIISVSVFVIAVVLDLSDLLRTVEYLTINNRYIHRLFKKPVESDKIVTIIIDDAAIEKVGRWPWSWDKLDVIIEACKYYSARTCSLIDIDFNREDNVYLTKNYSKILQENICNYIQQGYDTETIHRKISDINNRFIKDVKKYKNVFLCSKLKVPDQTMSLVELLDMTNRSKIRMLAQRRENIKSMDRFTMGSLTGKNSLITAFDMIPPIKKLNNAVLGTGYNRIFLDEDGMARHYSMAANYSNKVYPSLVTLMAAHYYKTPFDKIKVRPGKYIQFNEGDTNLAEFPLRIPIDEKGLMMINWTGPFKKTFIHYPYNLIAYHFSFIKGKQVLFKYRNAFDNPYFNPNVVYDSLNTELLNSGIIEPKTVQVVSSSLYFSWLMEYLMKQGAEYRDYLDAIGVNDSKSLKNMWDQVTMDNLLAIKLMRNKKQIPDYNRLLNELKLKDSSLLKEGYAQTIFFYKKGMIDKVRPLYFEKPSELKIGFMKKNVSLLDLKDKIVFSGLTATGLASFNPNPFENRYMMLGLSPNAFNTVITQQFLKPVSRILIYIILYLIIFFTAFSAMRTSLYGTIISVLFLAAYPLYSFYLFDYGYIVPIVFVEIAIILCWLASLSYKYIQELYERRKIRNMFSTMVAPEVLKLIEENPDKFNISGDLREASMFSSDVSGFTTISEGVTAQELADILNIYLTPMSNIIMKYNGYIDKYEGDAIKADFGVLPLQESTSWELDKEHSWKCCYASLEQQEDISIIQRLIQLKYGVKISARMGVNTGVVSAGNMGSEKKRQFSVMGAAVTLAEELEPINKLFETWVAIGPETYEKSKDYIETRFLNNLIMEEDEPLLPVYELYGWNTEKFLKYWIGKPVPSLIIEGFRKMTPEKILGYYDYYSKKKLEETEFISELKKLFKETAPIAVEYIKNNDLLEVYSFKNEIDDLISRIAEVLPEDKIKEFDSDREVSAFKKQMDGSSETWKKNIFTYKHILKIYNLALVKYETRIEYHLREELYKITDTLDKRIECFYKRCLFTPKGDSIAIEIGTNLKQLLDNIENISIAAAEMKVRGAQSKLIEKSNIIAGFIKNNPDEYHKMISMYCRPEEKMKKVCSMFEQARGYYLNREFDKAIEIFNEILKIRPDDGPSNKYIEYINKIKDTELEEDWNGAWIGEV